MSNQYANKAEKYAGLIVPFSFCTIGLPVCNCPFKKYWTERSIQKKVELINSMSDEELTSLLSFHQQCINNYRQQKQIELN